MKEVWKLSGAAGHHFPTTWMKKMVKCMLAKQQWPAGDRRRCARCVNGGAVTGHRNGYAIVWKCERGTKTAIRYLQSSKKYNGGEI